MDNTIDLPVIPVRKIMNDILYVLMARNQWKCFQKNMVLVLHAIGNSSSSGLKWISSKRWARLLEEYHDKRDIKWKWQSLDSISIKSPLGWKTWQAINRTFSLNK